MSHQYKTFQPPQPVSELTGQHSYEKYCYQDPNSPPQLNNLDNVDGLPNDLTSPSTSSLSQFNSIKTKCWEYLAWIWVWSVERWLSICLYSLLTLAIVYLSWPGAKCTCPVDFDTHYVVGVSGGSEDTGFVICSAKASRGQCSSPCQSQGDANGEAYKGGFTPSSYRLHCLPQLSDNFYYDATSIVEPYVSLYIDDCGRKVNVLGAGAEYVPSIDCYCYAALTDDTNLDNCYTTI